ncbi:MULTISPECIES: DUF6508 domain-containing protein [unclassified Brevundimonas]|uniref:DUF6508 domain-containing protein n=1 Tax=unclassified Brevundimonas TaxID=2622653 RepID=UPI0025C12E47|nr:MULTISPECIES: DUF6508 domain-containing protein [unclassified Brevundimonas]
MSDLLTLADELDATTDEQFVTGERTGTGFTYAKYAPVFHAWERALGAIGLGGPSDVYDRMLKGERIPNPSLETIASADQATLLGYATYIVRSEKFSEGHIAACHRKGYLAAIVRRLAQLENA